MRACAGQWILYTKRDAPSWSPYATRKWGRKIARLRIASV